MSAVDKLVIVISAVDQASNIFANVTQGLATLRERLLGTGEAAQEINRVGNALDGLSRALIASAGALSLAGIARLSDDYANMNARLKLVTDSATEFGDAQANVSRVAADTSSNLTATGDLYTVLQRSLDSLGDSTTNVADLTATITRAMTLSGASAAASAGALTQLSQALASGVLRGDEFNSIMEQAPRLSQAIADSLGVTTGALRAMAEEGKLTAQVVIDALREQSAAIAAEAATLPDTFGRAMERVKNAMTEVIGRITEAAGASGLFGRAIDGLVGIMQTLGGLLETLAGILGRVLSAFADLPGPIQAIILAWAAMKVTGTGLFDILGAILGALSSLVLALASGALAFVSFLVTLKAVSAGLTALWALMLANPVTALIAVVGLAAGAFLLFRDSAEEAAAALREQREAIRGEVEEVRALTNAMAQAKPGSDAYNEAARRLAEIIPALTLSMSSQGTLIAELGDGYEANARALADWTAEQERAMAALQTQELVVAAQRWRDAKEAADAHTRTMREVYGANEASRNIIQSLFLTLDRLAGKWTENNTKSLELNRNLREQQKAFRDLAVAVYDSTGSVDGMAQALRDAGASDEMIALITAEFREMERAAEAALDGLTDMQRRAAETGIAAARALSGTIGAVDQVVAELDERIKAHSKELDTALKAEAAGWRAVGEAARGTYTDAIAEVDRYTQARLDAIQASMVGERASAQEREAIARASALTTEFIEREATRAKLAALQDYQRQAMALLDEEGRRRVEAARASGGDVRAAEIEILKLKRDTLRQIESDYRAHIDNLNAEARRHFDQVKAIEDEIRQLKMSTEDRIRELQRGAMSDVGAYHDARKQAAEKSAEAERAILEGNFELAKELAKQAEDLYARNARAVQDANGNDVISQQRAAQEAVRGVTAAAEIQQRAMEGARDAAQQQGEANVRSAEEFEEALQGVQRQAEMLSEVVDWKIELQLKADMASVDALLDTIRPLVEERTYLLQMAADLESLRVTLADAQTYADNNPVELQLITGSADALLRDLKARLESLGDDASPQLTLRTDAALEAIGRVRDRVDSLDGASARVDVQVNDSAVQAVLNRLRQGTQSTHTIYVRTVQQNASGGPVNHYATGGPVYRRPSWDIVPGTGNTDSVPAGLQPGSFVLRKAATRYYGDLLRRFATGGLVPSMLMPGERLFTPGTVNRWGQGLFEALNAMTIPREHLAAALSGITAPVARFAAGGPVGSGSGSSLATATREVVDINLRIGTQSVRLTGARDQAAALAGALRELARGG